MLTTHQVYWISKSSDPLFTDRFRERILILHEAVTLQQAAEEAQWDGGQIRKAFWKGNSTVRGLPAFETIQPVWIEQDKYRLRAIILIPLRPMHKALAKLTILQPGTKPTPRPLDELPQVLTSFGVGHVEVNSKDQALASP